jgi:hypothetical protein
MSVKREEDGEAVLEELIAGARRRLRCVHGKLELTFEAVGVRKLGFSAAVGEVDDLRGGDGTLVSYAKIASGDEFFGSRAAFGLDLDSQRFTPRRQPAMI